MANAIYKAGVPAVTGTVTKGTLGTQGAVATAATYVTQAVSSVTGKATYAGPNSYNGTTVAKASSKNTPQS